MSWAGSADIAPLMSVGVEYTYQTSGLHSYGVSLPIGTSVLPFSGSLFYTHTWVKEPD